MAACSVASTAAQKVAWLAVARASLSADSTDFRLAEQLAHQMVAWMAAHSDYTTAAWMVARKAEMMAWRKAVAKASPSADWMAESLVERTALLMAEWMVARWDCWKAACLANRMAGRSGLYWAAM